MKKQIVIGAAVLFTAGMIFITGCKKDDTTGPVITLVGSATEMSILNAPWVDQGATAEDAEDGPVDVTVTGSVDIDFAGDYVITYSATDAAGNESTETRTVTVYNEAKDWAGTYLKANILDSTFSNANHTTFTGLWAYTQDLIITASNTVNKKIIFNRFNDLSNFTAAQMVYGTVVGTTLTIPSQSAQGLGTAGNQDHTFSGSGVVVTTSPFKIHITSTDQQTAPTAGTAYDSIYLTK